MSKKPLGISVITGRVIAATEKATLFQCLITVASWIFLRLFLEGVLEGCHRIGFSTFSYRSILAYFVHFPMFYLCLFLLLVIIIAAMTGEDVKKVTKTSSMGLFVLLLVPVIDWVFNRGYVITYPVRLEPYLVGFLNPFVQLSDIGVSPGQRITIVLITLLTGMYGYVKTRSLLRAVLLLVTSLVVIICFGGITTILAGNRPEYVFVSGSILYTDTQKFSAIYVLLFSVLFFVFLYIVNRQRFGGMTKSMRIERMAFYGATAILGFFVSTHQLGIKYDGEIFDYLGLTVMFMSLGLGFWSVQVINDLFDVDVDRIAGKQNPLLHGVPRKHYKILGMCLGLLSLCYALIINFSALLIISAYLLLGIIYSVPPVRSKRIPLVSTFILAVAVILSIAIGFSIYYGVRAMNAIPRKLLVPTLIAVTVGFSAKDIDHVVGDKARGITTLPVLLYQRGSVFGRLPIALLISTCYLYYLFFIPQVMVGAIVCASCTFFYTLLTTRPREWFYFLSLLAFGGYLLYSILSGPPL
ncbi:hypothetical protein AMJ83_09695 [candidate division WOR_3 bacterium SM23_42]|uniref:Uncharacterized protein n=1 Tax=candidate division WOR_3 bacterium SM23_42 TaxID=1703779 RepID=A0A0S8FQ09_UNCW3|nr:MAG: hypothetical protein AMJ83_09695 [candidate division WOR_3 bacterium SM23_42]